MKKGKKRERTIPTKVKRYDYPHGVPEEKDGTIILDGFTLHPPDVELPPDVLKKCPAYISEMELFDLLNSKGKSEEYLALMTKGEPFKKTQNPVYLIEAFLLAHQNGIYPPMWVLNFMAKTFKKYHQALGYEKYPKGKGRLTLDDLFGFTKWKGQTPVFKTLLNEERDEWLTMNVFKLTLLGYSAKDAAAMVAIKHAETHGWDKTGLKLKTLSAERIECIYSKRWKKIHDYDITRKINTQWLKENKSTFLKSFPTVFRLPLKRKTVI